MKKTLIAAGLVASLSLVAIGCNDDDDATPTPVIDAVESMVAEEVSENVEAAESIAADVEDAQESIAAEAEDAVESVEAAVEDATDS